VLPVPAQQRLRHNDDSPQRSRLNRRSSVARLPTGHRANWVLLWQQPWHWSTRSRRSSGTPHPAWDLARHQGTLSNSNGKCPDAPEKGPRHERRSLPFLTSNSSHPVRQMDWAYLKLGTVIATLRFGSAGTVAAMVARSLIEGALVWDWAVSKGVGEALRHAQLRSNGNAYQILPLHFRGPVPKHRLCVLLEGRVGMDASWRGERG
jgi:hypothetical protein